MSFSTLRHVLAPSLLLYAAGCGEVASSSPDASDPVEIDADNSIDGPPPGELPVTSIAAGTVVEGATLPLTGLLVTSDADTAVEALIYTVRSLPADGSLRLNDVALVVGSTFSQVDIDAGRMSYVHDGAETATDAFTWTVSDGASTVPATGAASFSITVTPVNDAPLIVNNPNSSVAEGSTSLITGTRLATSDAEGATLTYTLVTVPAASRGVLQKRTAGAGAYVTMAAGATFTQADIDASNIQYVDSGTDDTPLINGNNTAMSFQWRVTDGAGGLNPAAGANQTSFTITPVDDAPVISWKASACHRVNVANNANPVVSLTDIDTPVAQYSICVVSIGAGTSTIDNTTTTGSTTQAVMPALKNNGVDMQAQSCAAGNALGSLTLSSSATDHGGSVTWVLRGANGNIGANHTEQFPHTAPPC